MAMDYLLDLDEERYDHNEWIAAYTSPVLPERTCTKCRGTGFVTWEENQAPIGSGHYWPEAFSECCPDCIEKGKCPICGNNWVAFYNDLTDLHCWHCGYDTQDTM